jgi:hypothetical protein
MRFISCLDKIVVKTPDPDRDRGLSHGHAVSN